MDDTQSGKSSDSVETKETTAATEPEIKSKLSASAKSFSFNINAKSFQPQPSHQPPPPPPPPPQHPPQYIYDPATGMPMIIPPHMMPAGGTYSFVVVGGDAYIATVVRFRFSFHSFHGLLVVASVVQE
jgi:hypothetical protein